MRHRGDDDPLEYFEYFNSLPGPGDAYNCDGSKWSPNDPNSSKHPFARFLLVRI